MMDTQDVPSLLQWQRDNLEEEDEQPQFSERSRAVRNPRPMDDDRRAKKRSHREVDRDSSQSYRNWKEQEYQGDHREMDRDNVKWNKRVGHPGKYEHKVSQRGGDEYVLGPDGSWDTRHFPYDYATCDRSRGFLCPSEVCQHMRSFINALQYHFKAWADADDKQLHTLFAQPKAVRQWVVGQGFPGPLVRDPCRYITSNVAREFNARNVSNFYKQGEKFTCRNAECRKRCWVTWDVCNNCGWTRDRD